MDLAQLYIIHYPDPRLRRRTEEVAALHEQVRPLAARMLELMHEQRGVGLAAPQVGRPERLFVANVTGQPDGDCVYVNPVLSELRGSMESVEGCLSIPGVEVTVRRAAAVVLEAVDLEGRAVRVEAEGLAARVFQHELDHLDGRLIIDRMNETDRIATRRSLRQLEQEFKKKRSAAARR